MLQADRAKPRVAATLPGWNTITPAEASYAIQIDAPKPEADDWGNWSAGAPNARHQAKEDEYEGGRSQDVVISQLGGRGKIQTRLAPARSPQSSASGNPARRISKNQVGRDRHGTSKDQLMGSGRHDRRRLDH